LTGCAVAATGRHEEDTLDDSFRSSPALAPHLHKNTSGCYGLPEGCDCRTSCTLLAEWRGSSKDTYSVILSGGQPDSYLALGLATASGVMGPAPVVVCAADTSGLVNGTSNQTAIYWNTDTFSSAPASASKPADLVTPVAVEVVDGSLKCSLEVKASFEVAGTARDLNANAYYVLLATGPLAKGLVTYHSANRGHSSSALYWSDYNSYLPFSYGDCNAGVGCVGLPLGCETTRNCSVLVRFEAAAEDSYQFSLSGQVAAPTDYLAVGLSLDATMGDDSVVACIPPGDDGGVVMYWNLVGNSVPLPNTTVGVSEGKVAVNDGILTCSFLLQVARLDTQIF